MAKRKDVIRLDRPAYIVCSASVVGKKEKEGPLGRYFDLTDEDTTFGKDTFEMAEIELQHRTLSLLMGKAGIKDDEVGCLFAGDLLNQCVASSYGVRSRDMPFLGLYGACSTFSEGLMLASCAVSMCGIERAVAAASSHYCSAERQYRFPLEYGSVRTTTSQWTVTGSGAVLVSGQGDGPRVASCCAGRVVDKGITDSSNMGAAMAPAAADTLLRFFSETGRKPGDYDLILTGDLGDVGSDLFRTLMRDEGTCVENIHMDGGSMIFSKDQDVMAGGSGCGCIASVFCSKIMHDFASGDIGRMLLIATGALLSPTIVLQGESIASIAHLCEIEN